MDYVLYRRKFQLKATFTLITKFSFLFILFSYILEEKPSKPKYLINYTQSQRNHESHTGKSRIRKPVKMQRNVLLTSNAFAEEYHCTLFLAWGEKQDRKVREVLNLGWLNYLVLN